MPFAALVAVGVLTLAPTSPSTMSLQVSPASTCDHLVIGVYNPTDESIIVTPVRNGKDLKPLRLPPRTNHPINLVGREGLQAGVKVRGVQLGPWVWQAPADCSTILAPASPSTGVTTVPADVPQEHSPWYYWMGLIGLLMFLAGGLGILQHRIARHTERNRKPADATQRPGKHRRPSDPMSYVMRRQIVRSWIATRRTAGGGLANDG